MNAVLPDDFDWIAARASCTTTQAFNRLRLQLMEDVDKRNKMSTDNEKSDHSFNFGIAGDRMTVSVEGKFIGKTVLFIRTAVGIDVLEGESNKLLLQAFLTIDNDGKCVFRIGDSEYSFWQFRKMALEDVFFTSVAKWVP